MILGTQYAGEMKKGRSLGEKSLTFQHIHFNRTLCQTRRDPRRLHNHELLAAEACPKSQEAPPLTPSSGCVEAPVYTPEGVWAFRSEAVRMGSARIDGVAGFRERCWPDPGPRN